MRPTQSDGSKISDAVNSNWQFHPAGLGTIPTRDGRAARKPTTTTAANDFAPTAVFPYDEASPKGTLEQGRLVEIEENESAQGGERLLQNDERFSYDGEFTSPSLPTQ